MNVQQKTNCLLLASYLESIPPESYDHGTYLEQRQEDCGTRACALGHAALSGLFPFTVEPYGGSAFFRDSNGIVKAARYFADFHFGDGAYEEVFSTLAFLNDEDEAVAVNDVIKRIRLRAARWAPR